MAPPRPQAAAPVEAPPFDAEATLIAPRPAQPLPLEAVWPVQERAGTAAPPAAPPAASGSAASFLQRQSLQLEPSGDEVHALLRGVQPGQPTDSAVELVLPRRPRPVAPASTPAPVLSGVQREVEKAPTMVPTEIGPLPSDLWTLLGQTPPTSQADSAAPPSAAAGTGAPASGNIPASNDVMRANAEAERPAPAPPLGSVMRANAEAERPAPAPPVGRVTRAIAEAERPAPAPPLGRVMRAIAEAEQPAPAPPVGSVMRAIAEAERPAPQPVPQQTLGQSAVSDVAPPSVQREISIEEPVVTAETGEAAEVDVDKLARQVYNEVRRRLASEWERNRGRR
jgi:hypothetical protein